LNYAHKNQNNFNTVFVPVQLNERMLFFHRRLFEVDPVLIQSSLGFYTILFVS